MTQEEQKLKDFLISKGAFDAYMKNIQSVDCDGACCGKDEEPTQIEPIIFAFTWAKTPEKRSYWIKLHNEYKNTKQAAFSGFFC